MARVDAAYKILHEQFVSGHNGTSVLDIALTVTTAPVGVLLRNVVTACLFTSGVHSSGLKFAVDMLTLVLPVLLCFTVLADHVLHTLSALLLLVVLIVMVAGRPSSKQDNSNASWDIIANTAVTGKRPFITNFRAYVNVATAIGILAVDFVIFPRRFAKAETYGSGLMDVGVGAFVISNGIVSPEAKPHFQSNKGVMSMLRNIYKCLLSCVPLVALGGVRLLSVRATNYHEHITEYGVHWNFFLTLALVKLLSTLVLCIFSSRLSWVICVGVASGYQYLLTGRNLTQFLLLGSDGQGGREGFLDANREGIMSCLGYVALYFAGVQLGSYILQARSRLREWVWVCVTLFLLDAVLWYLLDYTESNIQPISRRMANLSFVIWMMAYNVQLLASFLLVDLATIVLKECGYIPSHPAVKLCILEATNRNGLSYFLLANLLTGAVNLSMATIHAAPSTALSVVLLYMLLLSSIAALLHVKNITLKFW